MRWTHKTKEDLITEIRHLKKELRVLEVNERAGEMPLSMASELEKTVENLNLVGIVLDDTGTIMFSNSFANRVLGYEHGELVGKNFFDVLVPAEEREQRINSFNQALEKGGLFEQRERTMLSKTNQIRYVELNSTIFNDATEDVRYLTVIGEDVTERRKVAEALSRSNAQLQDIINNTSDLIQLISMSGRFLYVNKAWLEITGYESDELATLRLKDILHPDFAEEALLKFEKIKNGEKIADFEVVFRRKDGRRLYLSGSVNCRYDKETPTAYRCIFHNSTAKVRAERSSNLYSNIAQATIRSTNLDDLYLNIHQELGKVIDVKNFFIAQYDSAKSYLYFPYYIDEYFDSRVHFTKRKLGNGLTEYAIAANKPLILRDEEIYKLAEEKKIYLYGVVPKVMICVPLRIGNKVTGIIGLKSYERQNKYEQRDLELLDFISGQVALAIARKQAEDVLARETARLTAIIEGSSHLMWSVNRRMLLTSFNQEYLQLIENQLGVKPQLTLSTEKMGFRMVSFEDRKVLEEKYKLAFKGEQQHFEVQLDSPDGEEKWVEVFLNPIKNNGNIEEVSGIGRDITNLKKYQQDIVKAKDEAERSLKVKERFLANMSHEIRTPMNGVIGMIDLMIDTPLNDEQKDYVQTIRKSSETLLHILNDILDLAKIEAGKMALNEAPLVFKDVFDRLQSLFNQVATAKNNKIITEYDDNLPEFVIADETRLLQILSNFTSNALKFTENGTVKIKSSLVEKRGKLNRIKFEIIDSGIGITEENLKILFNAFQQVDNSTKKSFGGTGLGLAISKELCRMMKGEVGVTSEWGKGSTFWFTIEIKQTDISPMMVKKDAPVYKVVNHFDAYHPYLLVVDDNATNRKVASEILRKSGCEVITADSGQKAIKLVQASILDKPFDIIFMDIQMPEMDGIETTQILRQNNTNLPPIIAMTAYAMKEDRDRFMANGMNDYVPKPIRAEVLVRKVAEWVGKKELGIGELGIRNQLLENSDSVSMITNQEQIKNTQHPIPNSLITDNHKVLDPEIIKQLSDSVGGDMSFVVSILEGFEEEATEQIANAIEGYKASNCKKVQGELHTLKGNAGTLGAMRLHEITRIIEEKAKHCDFQVFESEVLILQDEFDRFKRELVKMKNE